MVIGCIDVFVHDDIDVVVLMIYDVFAVHEDMGNHKDILLVDMMSCVSIMLIICLECFQIMMIMM